MQSELKKSLTNFNRIKLKTIIVLIVIVFHVNSEKQKESKRDTEEWLMHKKNIFLLKTDYDFTD